MDYPTPRSEKLFLELCEEIDQLKWELDQTKRDVEYWKTEYQKTLSKYTKSVNDGVGFALKFALSVKDTEDGSLIIPKENRDLLHNTLKPQKDVKKN